jgi:hypothetical protein
MRWLWAASAVSLFLIFAKPAQAEDNSSQGASRSGTQFSTDAYEPWQVVPGMEPSRPARTQARSRVYLYRQPYGYGPGYYGGDYLPGYGYGYGHYPYPYGYPHLHWHGPLYYPPVYMPAENLFGPQATRRFLGVP